MLKYIIPFAFSLSAFATHDLSFTNYLKLQESLAGDDFKSAVSAHKKICETDLVHYKDIYNDCDKAFSNIDELRSSFKKISDVYLLKGDKKELSKLTKASCPMAKAKWIQKNGPIANPYYGKSMLECGEKI